MTNNNSPKSNSNIFNKDILMYVFFAYIILNLVHNNSGQLFKVLFSAIL